MGTKGVDALEHILNKSALRRWRRRADRAEALGLDALHDLRGDARALRRQIDRVLHVAEGRLALPVIGPNPIRRPPGCDWAWRPELWRGPVTKCGHAAIESRTRLCDGTTVFHDCRISEIVVRQQRNRQATDIAPFGLRLEVFRFDGSFLSLVLDLPQQALSGLLRNHVIRLDLLCEVERPMEIFARLNVRHGPNVEQVVREIPLADKEVMVEFDLFYTGLNEKRVEGAWLDLIFEGAELNQILLRDVTMTRRLRAEL